MKSCYTNNMFDNFGSTNICVCSFILCRGYGIICRIRLATSLFLCTYVIKIADVSANGR